MKQHKKTTRIPSSAKTSGSEANARSSWRDAGRSGRGVVPELLRCSLAAGSFLNPTGSAAALCDRRFLASAEQGWPPVCDGDCSACFARGKSSASSHPRCRRWKLAQTKSGRARDIADGADVHRRRDRPRRGGRAAVPLEIAPQKRFGVEQIVRLVHRSGQKSFCRR